MSKQLVPNDENHYAFELVFSSMEISDIYDHVLDRHVSTVIVYQVMNGFPKEIANQSVICDGNDY